ncbi:cytidine deaminase [Pedobacter sp. BAL39]|uniref:cytidine deaminase n=1 Tax=Pedobacter sp. BAL39 TaxID=391596 RepID=UPI000155921A|nr:cytidine deaminase [Pedobacter sp. BAL39]EDM36032.1 cytidine deaminase [Pedobacter sp. BAL39]
MEQKIITISYESFSGIDMLSDVDRQLCLKAEEALNTSYAPYSHFRVGTAIQLKGDQIVLGSNQENVAYPSGLCAERVALFAIGAANPSAVIERMAITAKADHFQVEQPVTSCGACLQVMAEFEKKQQQEIEVLFYCIGGEIMKVRGIRSLLPFVFVESRLEG